MKNLLKNIYKYLPFKREIFSFLKLIWVPKESVYRHLHFVGVFKVKIDNNRKFKIKHYGFQVENEIFWVGLRRGWESESFNLWIRLCEKSSVIMDIGANTGIYSLIAKTVKPDSKVYAFDPVERVFNRLTENRAINNFDIHCYEKAVSNKDGEAIIYDTLSDHIYSVTVNRNLCGPTTGVKEIKVETVTLNTFIKQNNIQKIDLMKIDVETHEPEVLEGYSEFLTQHRPTMLIEILEDEAGRKIEKLLEGIGYLYFNIIEKGGVRQEPNLLSKHDKNYLICSEETARDLKLI